LQESRELISLMTMTSNSNDGGIVASLFLMVVTLSYTMFSAVAYYEKRSPNNNLMRLLSGWANIGNSAIHVLLIIYTLSNADNTSPYWLKERELGGIEGPVFLALLNGGVGILALRGYSMWVPLVWNSFVAAAGTLLPIVWFRFLSEGLSDWPYIVVFIWFVIFAMELAAFTASVTHLAVANHEAVKVE
jgi:hypothetical protein